MYLLTCSSSSCLQYLRNIIFEYMMGRETRVIGTFSKIFICLINNMLSYCMCYDYGTYILCASFCSCINSIDNL